uniref:hypothetical protein n=1 Tax=uncultured Altererythrobacter sp. TaxID=500840 RepID=UPI002614D758|nr:hypothetical protein [uncultured Altererythrobacter sp.]
MSAKHKGMGQKLYLEEGLKGAEYSALFFHILDALGSLSLGRIPRLSGLPAIMSLELNPHDLGHASC